MAYKFNDIKLDKGMYGQSGMSFSQTLEMLDPSENYKGTPYEGMDAYQRQLKRFGIKVRGANSAAAFSPRRTSSGRRWTSTRSSRSATPHWWWFPPT